MKTLALIGAGQLGSRYLQGLAGVERYALRIWVCDPRGEARERAWDRWCEVGGEQSPHEVLLVEGGEELPEEIDLAIVETTAEVAIRKGHVYATVFADDRNRDVLFATVTKEDTTRGRFADDLRAHGGDPGRIKHASMDMSRSYKSGARRHCPKATLVFDKFHVVKLANEAVDKVCRRASRELPLCGERRER